MVWIFVVGGLSIWDDLDGVTERRATLPGPVAVLNDFMEVNGGNKDEVCLRHRFDDQSVHSQSSVAERAIQAPLRFHTPISTLTRI